MTLRVELENQHFLDIDFENEIYITGSNQKQLWKIFRSLYYYFNKDPKLTANVYGENKIELILDDNPLSEKNNNVYFINDRNSIYNQMIYKKDSMLFELLNSLSDDTGIDHSIETINDEQLQLEIVVQKALDAYSNNLKIEFDDMTYLDFLKNNLEMVYESEGNSYPLEFMDTEILLDEFLNFLEFKLKDNGRPIWLVLYNLDSFISPNDKTAFLKKIRKLIDIYDLKLIYLGNSLKAVPISSTELDKIIVAADEFHQLLPYDELLQSVRLHYPNEFDLSGDDFADAIKRVSPYVGSSQKFFISNKDLVLLKVVNDILGYETSFDLKNQLLSKAETEFLRD